MYKPQMNGFGDKTLPDFQPISMSPAVKDNFRKDKTEVEFIQSFLQSAKVIAEKIDKQKETTGMKMFFDYSLTLPAIYLCRHCIEISIKHAISKKEQQPKPRHGLNGLWRDLMKYIPQDMCSVEERITLNNMRKFIDIIDALDDDGTKLRYAVQKDGSDSLHTFL